MDIVENHNFSEESASPEKRPPTLSHRKQQKLCKRLALKRDTSADKLSTASHSLSRKFVSQRSQPNLDL
jgi:hypothetical protein